MSVELIAVCFKKQFDNHADRDVMLALCDHANDEGICWPSRAHIAWKMDRHPETVKQCLKKFRKQGLIETRHEANNDLSKSPVLRVLPHKLEDKAPRGDRGVSDPPGGGVSDPPGRGMGDSPKSSVEPSVNSRRDADASASVIKNPFGYYCEVAKALKVEIVPEDRKDTAKHFKDLVRINEPTEEELKRVVSKMLEARTAGVFWSPQKALEKVRGSSNVTQLRPAEPARPQKRVIS